MLQVFRMVAVCLTGKSYGRQALRRDKILSVDMGDGRRLADIRHPFEYAVLRAHFAGHPAGGHGIERRLLDRHPVHHENPPVLVRFHKASLHPVFAAHDIRNTGEILGKEFRNRGTEVLEEAFGLCSISDDHPGEHRHPGGHVVAPALQEFFPHPGSPVLRPGLIAVHHQMPYAAGPEHVSGGIPVHVEIMAQVCAHCIRIQLVHLQPRGFRRGGMILFPRQRCTETIHRPSALRHIPVQHSVPESVRKDHDFPSAAIAFRRKIIVQVVGSSEGGFLFGMVDSVFRVEPELRHKRELRIRIPLWHGVMVIGLGIAVLEPEISCRKRLE